MAVRYAVATGNWSAIGTWDGGASIPAVGDTVHANTFTVTIDQDINVDSLRTTSGSGITAGGGFVISANGGIDVVCTNATTGLWAGTSTVLTHSATSGTNTFTGKVIHNGVSGVSLILVSGAGGRLDITGALTASAGAGRIACQISANATVNIVGNVTAANFGANATALYITATCAVTIVGDVTGNQISDYGVSATTGTPTCVITGNVSAGSNNASYAISWLVSSALTVNGITAGGSNASAAGIFSNTAATITLNGTVNGSTGPGISCSGSCAIISNGTVNASSAASGIVSSGASSTVRVSGDCIDHSSTGQRAIYAVRIVGNWSTAHYWRWKNHSGGTVDLVTTDSLTGLPSAGNVRNGTTYGASSEFTGTLIVPNPSDVRHGVQTDNTVGTADLTAADLWAYLTSSAVVSGSMGERLKNIATVDSVGTQLEAMGA